jgi:hypothetical protein
MNSMKQTPCLGCKHLRTSTNRFICGAVEEFLDRGVATGSDIDGLPACPEFEKNSKKNKNNSSKTQNSTRLLIPSSRVVKSQPQTPTVHKTFRRTHRSYTEPEHRNDTREQTYRLICDVIRSYNKNHARGASVREIINETNLSSGYTWMLVAELEGLGRIVRRPHKTFRSNIVFEIATTTHQGIQ